MPEAHYDGLAKSGWFGIDGRTEQWVAGAVLSKSWSETDYRRDASAGEQRMKTDLTVLFPYGRWALDERIAVHAIAGIGSGEVRNLREGSVEQKSDLLMRMLSVGVERQLALRPEQLSDVSSCDACIGYGFDLPSTGGMVTPFAENIHGGGSRSLRVGARFEAPRDNLSMELSEERHRSAADAASADSIRFDFSLRF